MPTAIMIGNLNLPDTIRTRKPFDFKFWTFYLIQLSPFYPNSTSIFPLF